MIIFVILFAVVFATIPMDQYKSMENVETTPAKEQQK